MNFTKENLADIKKLLSEKQSVELKVEIIHSIFEFGGASPPENWTGYPIAVLSKQEYSSVLARVGADLRGALLSLEMVSELRGAHILYKKLDDKHILMRFNWPIQEQKE